MGSTFGNISRSISGAASDGFQAVVGGAFDAEAPEG